MCLYTEDTVKHLPNFVQQYNVAWTRLMYVGTLYGIHTMNPVEQCTCP